MLLPRTLVAVLATNSRCLVRNPNNVQLISSHFLPISVLKCDDLRIRCLCSSPILLEKASSKIEEAVQHLKKEEKTNLEPPEAPEKKVSGIPKESAPLVKPVDLTTAEQVSILINKVFLSCINLKYLGLIKD